MNKKQRDKVLYWSDTATFVEWILYTLAVLFFIGGITQSVEADKVAEGIGITGMILFIGLLRIRMLLRAQRVDALLREAEEEARRQGHQP